MSSASPKIIVPKTISLGCRLNIAEGGQIDTLLNGRAIQVVNSCGVTQSAVKSSRAAVRRAHKANPDVPIVVTGCAAQIAPGDFAHLPGVARVIGNGDKFDAGAYAAITPGRSAQIRVNDVMTVARTTPQMLPSFDSHTRAFMEVQNGCDHRCTFCIIPYGRGPSRSVPLEEVVENARALVASGFGELVLTGVDTTSYGADFPQTPRLSDLITAILDGAPALRRLRIGSIDVAEIDDALFELLTQEPRMMGHVHLSLQAGDDLILKRMKRRHSRADAVAMADRLMAARPDIAIGADLISGFPTEDDAAAARTRALIDDCHIRFAHIFPYSARSGTPAACMPQVAAPVIKARAAALREVAGAAQQKWLQSLVGSHQSLLVERDGISGHIGNFARTRLNDGAAQPGEILPITILGLDGDGLIGKRAA